MTEGEAIILAAIVAATATVVASIIGARAHRATKRIDAKLGEVDSKLDTGNGAQIGATVHRVEQNQEIVLANQHLQTATLAEHGRKLVELDEGMKRHSDLMNDHLMAMDTAAELLVAQMKDGERDVG